MFVLCLGNEIYENCWDTFTCHLYLHVEKWPEFFKISLCTLFYDALKTVVQSKCQFFNRKFLFQIKSSLD